ncbi:gamma-glutamylcyclotransferase family protein [Variovorax sp. J2P1-59]|uniref:gamma-glutamylcyclotransferase family protein n=1 Tax=Variovorax flavidus TaxID=3053501 RepID=UPI0025775904|nr:gamma-glutamylcyclotransferase family protein [Variovorax sp. J2P1-59]MDM0074104.1 gamma-glutamylcyclotransferase family protein [Variovorax sp. J2P1-59]
MPQSAAVSRYVFVYGTLRSGGLNDIARFHPKPERVADARIAGTLYDLGAYPGAVLGGPGELFGEIYRITPELEAQLDVLEEVKPDDSGEYIKREVLVEPDEGGERLPCLIYEIHPQRIVGRAVISSGDWLRAR